MSEYLELLDNSADQQTLLCFLRYFVAVMYPHRASKSMIFFCGEGPRSRSYRRTAALRLIVQPCDEDEQKDHFFFHFSK